VRHTRIMALLVVIPITTVVAIAITCQSHHQPGVIDFGLRHGTSLSYLPLLVVLRSIFKGSWANLPST
jgi:ABC-type transporter Mla maintaining outer membrane lipid asymmetry permease subunit MlaE